NHAVGISANTIRSMKQQIGEAAFAAAWLAVTGEDAQPEWLEPHPLAPSPRGEGEGEDARLAEGLRALAAVYAQGGAEAVRAVLRQAGADDDQIEALLARVATSPLHEGEGAGVRATSTLPDETLNLLAGNTAAVMTDAPEKREEWRVALRNFREQAAANGADWAHELALAEALLAVLDGVSPALPADNPYAGLVAQVLEVIARGG
ncbi:MAG: hypothetical protein JNJ61_13710, partial [Anaerolineae bacterium]|nr:hypothetical protein [Anaerolineae bacterium]